MIRIGISCCRYEPWRGVFYREGLAQRRELEYAARHFPIVEINGSFYSLQRPRITKNGIAPRGKTGTLSVCFPISPISASGRKATFVGGALSANSGHPAPASNYRTRPSAQTASK